MVNFFGHFGLACQAAGAEHWASGWYKSVYRLRIADKLAGGRAYPSYWTHKAICDVHLQEDFDKLNKASVLSPIFDVTDASSGLFEAVQQNVSVNNIPAWRYSQSNVGAAEDHYLLSSIQAEFHFNQLPEEKRLDFVQQWLEKALAESHKIVSVVGGDAKTRVAHVQAWYDAFTGFRRDHNV